MNLSPKNAFIAEMMGIVLIILASGWQVFLQQTVEDLNFESAVYELSTKLDYLLMYTGQIGYSVIKDEPLRWTADWGELNERFIALRRSRENVRRQSDLFRQIAGVTFILGTLLVSVGRYHEIKDRFRSKN